MEVCTEGTPVASCCGHGDEPSAVISGGEKRLPVVLLPAEGLVRRVSA